MSCGYRANAPAASGSRCQAFPRADGVDARVKPGMTELWCFSLQNRDATHPTRPSWPGLTRPSTGGCRVGAWARRDSGAAEGRGEGPACARREAGRRGQGFVARPPEHQANSRITASTARSVAGLRQHGLDKRRRAPRAGRSPSSWLPPRPAPRPPLLPGRLHGDGDHEAGNGHSSSLPPAVLVFTGIQAASAASRGVKTRLPWPRPIGQRHPVQHRAHLKGGGRPVNGAGPDRLTGAPFGMQHMHMGGGARFLETSGRDSRRPSPRSRRPPPEARASRRDAPRGARRR